MWINLDDIILRKILQSLKTVSCMVLFIPFIQIIQNRQINKVEWSQGMSANRYRAYFGVIIMFSD